MDPDSEAPVGIPPANVAAGLRAGRSDSSPGGSEGADPNRDRQGGSAGVSPANVAAGGSPAGPNRDRQGAAQEQPRRHEGTKARRLVFNRTVSLKDTRAKIEKKL